MNTLEQLNQFSNGTIDFDDQRDFQVILDLSTSVNQTASFYAGVNFNFLFGNDITEITGAGSITFSIDVGATNAVIDWTALDVSVTTALVGTVYSATFDSVEQWTSIKANTKIASNIAQVTPFAVTASLDWIDGASLDAFTTSWTLTTTIVPFAAELSSATSVTYWQDEVFALTGNPELVTTDLTSPSYTVTITPSVTAAIDTITSASEAAYYTFNATTKVFTVTGLFADVNTVLNSLSIIPGPGYRSAYTLEWKSVNGLYGIITIVNQTVTEGEFQIAFSVDSPLPQTATTPTHTLPLATDITNIRNMAPASSASMTVNLSSIRDADLTWPASPAPGLSFSNTGKGALLYTLTNPLPSRGPDGARDSYGFQVAVNDTYIYVSSPGDDISGNDNIGRLYRYTISNPATRATLNDVDRFLVDNDRVVVSNVTNGVRVYNKTMTTLQRTFATPAGQTLWRLVAMSSSYVVIQYRDNTTLIPENKVYNISTGALVSTVVNPGTSPSWSNWGGVIVGDRLFIDDYLYDNPSPFRQDAGRVIMYNILTGAVLNSWAGTTAFGQAGRFIAGNSQYVVGIPGFEYYKVSDGTNRSFRVGGPTPATSTAPRGGDDGISLSETILLIGRDVYDIVNQKYLYRVSVSATNVITSEVLVSAGVYGDIVAYGLVTLSADQTLPDDPVSVLNIGGGTWTVSNIKTKSDWDTIKDPSIFSGTVDTSYTATINHPTYLGSTSKSWTVNVDLP